MIGGAVAAPATSPVAGLTGSTGSTTLVLVVLLVALGLGMVAVAVWLVRSTRRDAPALAPLEVMGDRGFARAGPDDRDAKLTSARPDGAAPPAPMIPDDPDDRDESEDAAVAAVPEQPPVEEPAEAPVGEDR
jgi:hypothetical protein